MKKINNIISVIVAITAMTITSCDKFLDVLPDHRAEVDSKEKIQKLLTSAYSTHTYLTITEYMSDNVEDLGDDIPSDYKMLDELYHWENITAGGNDDSKHFWNDAYSCIAHANQALASIESLGGVEATGLYAEMAEALLCRAYAHFMLVNIFCQNYNTETSNVDLGIPYMDHAETELNPKYERGTVADVYRHIDEDIQAALPYVSDAYYRVPKYHFNQKAAYAFATRFYLFYEKWDKVVEYADKCIGTADPTSTMLRKWSKRAELASDREVRSNDFIDASKECNLLLLTGFTEYGLFSVWAQAPKISHTTYIGNTETCYAANIWGSSDYYDAPSVVTANGCSQFVFSKIPYLFEYTDPVNLIGYPRTAYPAFTADEVLLNRAEAYILLGEYNKACEDMNYWMHNIVKYNGVLTPEIIKDFYARMDYARWDNYDKAQKVLKPNFKKKLNPKFEIPSDPYAESMLQCVLQFKRIENTAQGLRWFDIKRYGIEIWRRTLHEDSSVGGIGYAPFRLDDVLTVDDPRRAVQLPEEVISAGLEKNPR